MINEKLSELTALSTLPDTALVYFVDLARPEGDRSVKMTVADAKVLFAGSGTPTLQDVIAENATATTAPIFNAGVQIGTAGFIIFNTNGAFDDYIFSSDAVLLVKHLNQISFETKELASGTTSQNYVNSIYKTVYNASTNTPALADGDTNLEGCEYYVSVGATRDFGSGDIVLAVGDILAKRGGDYYKKVDNNQSGGTPKLESINGTKETATITATKNLDWDSYAVFNYTLGAPSTLSDINLPTQENTKDKILNVTGDFSLSLPGGWVALDGNDTYDGTRDNLIVANCINGTSGSKLITYSLKNFDSVEYLLDNYGTGISVAYSIRRLSSTITNVAQIRRSSDDAVRNFTPEEIFDGTLTSWCGSGSAFIKIWYDQSGNGNDADNGTNAQQPMIINAGVPVVDDYGNVTIQSDGTDDFLEAGSVIDADMQLVSSFVFANPKSAAGTSIAVSLDTSPRYYAPIITSGDLDFSYNDVDAFVLESPAVIEDALISSISNATDAKTYYNSTLKGTLTSTAGTLGNEPRLFGTGTAYWAGTISETVVYKADKTSDRVAIENNINRYFTNSMGVMPTFNLLAESPSVYAEHAQDAVYTSDQSNYVYVSLNDKVVRQNLTTGAYDTERAITAKAGGICIHDGKLYVAQTDAADFNDPTPDVTIYALNLTTLAIEQQVTQTGDYAIGCMGSDGTNLYVGYGNSALTSAKIRKVNSTTLLLEDSIIDVPRTTNEFGTGVQTMRYHNNKWYFGFHLDSLLGGGVSVLNTSFEQLYSHSVTGSYIDGYGNGFLFKDDVPFFVKVSGSTPNFEYTIEEFNKITY